MGKIGSSKQLMNYATALTDGAMSNIEKLKLKLKDDDFGQKVLERLESFNESELDELVREINENIPDDGFELTEALRVEILAQVDDMMDHAYVACDEIEKSEDFTAKAEELKRLGETVVAKMNEVSNGLGSEAE